MLYLFGASVDLVHELGEHQLLQADRLIQLADKR